MKRVLVVALVAVAVGGVVAPSSAAAAGTCGITQANAPYRSNGKIHELWDYKCNVQWQIDTVLQYESGGSWSNATCTSQTGGVCSIWHPNQSQFYGGGVEHSVTDTYQQDQIACNFNFRVEQSVYDVNGTRINHRYSPELPKC
jgi:hypothetical protein